MKSSFVAAVAVVLTAVAATAFLRNSAGQAATPVMEVSQHNADALQAKIDAIKKAAEVPGKQGASLDVFEAELESYVLFVLKEDIPARLDAFDVQLTAGAVAADTKMTFSPNSTGNPLIDALVSGTHQLFVKGTLAGSAGEGKFELEQVRIDGIPVPNLLIESLVDKYVKPKYPDVDLNAPFELPWEIDSIVVSQGKAAIAY